VPKFSEKSINILTDADPRLQDLFNEVIKYIDCTVICSYRNELDQEIAFSKGYSKTHYPNSKHNHLPALALDVTPYPEMYQDKEKLYYFAGFVKGIAAKMDIRIRYGGDWDNDNDLKDQTFNDLVHFEII
jgi:peptidoglycan LD-endopeptidase CwlK